MEPLSRDFDRGLRLATLGVPGGASGDRLPRLDIRQHFMAVMCGCSPTGLRGLGPRSTRLELYPQSASKDLAPRSAPRPGGESGAADSYNAVVGSGGFGLPTCDPIRMSWPTPNAHQRPFSLRPTPDQAPTEGSCPAQWAEWIYRDRAWSWKLVKYRRCCVPSALGLSLASDSVEAIATSTLDGGSNPVMTTS